MRTQDGYIAFLGIGGLQYKTHREKCEAGEDEERDNEVSKEVEQENIKEMAEEYVDVEDPPLSTDDVKDEGEEPTHEGVKVPEKDQKLAQNGQEVEKLDEKLADLSIQTREQLLQRLKSDFADIMRGNNLALALLCALMFALGLVAGR